MKYRVVLFISAASGQDRSALARLDDEVTKALSPQHLVRDHDLGRGHMKIVLHTDDPTTAFDAARAVIPEEVLLNTSAFYSEIGSQQEYSLWPSAVIWEHGDD
jgi:hypothetical protein